MTVILVRKWFDERNGNTYHTVRVHQPGIEMTSDITYGYGESWIETASETIGINVRDDMRDNRSEYIIDVQGVKRKMDLHG